MIHLRDSSTIRSLGLEPLRPARKTLGAILRDSVKTQPGLWLGIAALALFGVVWAVAKLMFVAGSATVLALLRDAGHQVAGGGIPGSAGSAAGGANGPDSSRSPPTKAGRDGLPPNFTTPPREPDYSYSPNDPQLGKYNDGSTYVKRYKDGNLVNTERVTRWTSEDGEVIYRDHGYHTNYPGDVLGTRG